MAITVSDGARPQPLVDGVTSLSRQAHAGEDAGLLLELRFAERQPADPRELLRPRLRHLVVEARDIELAIGRGQVRENAREHLNRIGDGTSPHAGMPRLLEGFNLDVHLHDAAQLIGERGHAGVEVRGVGENDEVGVEHLPVLLEEVNEVLRTDLFLALDHELHVARQRSDGLEVARDRGHVGHDPALVVGDAAAVEPAALLHRLEGRRGPARLVAHRLHVVVAIEEHGGRALRVQEVAVDVGVHALEGQDLDVLDPHRAQGVGHRGGRLLDRLLWKGTGGDARDLRQFDQGLLEGLEVLFQVGQRFVNRRAGGHARGGSFAFRSWVETKQRRYQIGRRRPRQSARASGAGPPKRKP